MSELSRIIAAEVRENGPIPFARFMELALYCPVYGYYERDTDTVGRQGDFQTSVSVGTAFGELLAHRFARWLEGLMREGQGTPRLIEVGAHDGRLAQDILRWLKSERFEVYRRLEYCILEPSFKRRDRQKQLLANAAGTVQWFTDLHELAHADGCVQGIIFSNELLDAMPVHRLGWDRGAGAWFEWLVGQEEERFVWARGPALGVDAVSELAGWVPAELLEALPDGFVVETSPRAMEWWRAAGNILQTGWLMTLDYGFDEVSALMPERAMGTLRSYRRHQVSRDVLEHPGRQDITAHVHFGLIRQAGEAAGLRTEFLGDQGRFLSQVLQTMIKGGVTAENLSPQWIRQFKTLIHPDHFGRSFRVLVQSKGV